MIVKVESSEHIKDIKCLYIKDKTCELDVMQEKRSRLTSMFYLSQEKTSHSLRKKLSKEEFRKKGAEDK